LSTFELYGGLIYINAPWELQEEKARERERDRQTEREREFISLNGLKTRW